MGNSKDLRKQIELLKKENLRLSTIQEILKKKMSSVSKLTNSVNKNFDTLDIINLLKTNLKDLMNVKKFVLFINTSKWETLLSEGISLTFSYKDIEKELSNTKIIQSVSSSKNPILNQFDYVIPAFHKDEALAFLLLKDINIEHIDCSEREKVNYLEILLHLTIISLENKKLFKKNKSNKRLKEEIDLAAEVQKELIPSSFPLSNSYEFYGKYIPFEEIGGDYYDVIKLNEQKIAFCICDVSGKGISAGMLMSNFQASIRTLLTRNLSLIELIKQLNLKFLKISKQSHFISMFIGVYNTKTRQLEYINAGHNPPVLISNTTQILLEEGCTILGAFEELPTIVSKTIHLEKNTLLAMYTDGLSEIENELGEEFGIKNISKYLIKNQNKPLQEITDGFIKAIHSFKGDNDVFDDISLLCAKFPLSEL